MKTAQHTQLTILSSVVTASMALTACGGGSSFSNRQAQSITFNAPATANVGDTVALAAAASSKLAVTYKSTTSNICTVVGSKVTAKAAGDCTITASQAGNNSFTPAKDASATIKINQQEQTITFAPPAALVVGDTAELTATASSKLPVTYSSTTTDICTVADSKVTAVAKGDCKLTASQVGDEAFKAAAEASVSVAVVSTTLEIAAESLAVNQAGKIMLSGKPVSDSITAMLGDKAVAVTKKDGYMAEIALTAAQLAVAGDMPLVIKSGDNTIYDGIVSVALPATTGDSYTVKKTGITTCGNATDNTIACTDQAMLGDYYQTNQDGEVQAGADMTYTKVAHQTTKDGKKSMEYCIYDNVSGLTWEAKTDDDGLRDKDWKYTWYDSNSATNGGVAGIDTPEQDSCNATFAKCNSENYINKLNAMRYCGHNDWRLPTDIELVGIREFGKAKAPYINAIFEHIALGEISDGQQGNYLTSRSIAAPESNISVGTQNMVVGNFSKDVISLDSTKFKNAFGHHVMAVRGN